MPAVPIRTTCRGCCAQGTAWITSPRSAEVGERLADKPSWLRFAIVCGACVLYAQALGHAHSPRWSLPVTNRRGRRRPAVSAGREAGRGLSVPGRAVRRPCVRIVSGQGCVASVVAAVALVAVRLEPDGVVLVTLVALLAGLSGGKTARRVGRPC